MHWFHMHCVPQALTVSLHASQSTSQQVVLLYMQLAFNKPVKIPSWAVVSFTDPHRTGHDLEVRRRCCPRRMVCLQQQGGSWSVAQAPCQAQLITADFQLAFIRVKSHRLFLGWHRACWRRCAISWRAATWTSRAARCHPSPGTTRPALSVRSCTSESSADTLLCSGVLSCWTDPPVVSHNVHAVQARHCRTQSMQHRPSSGCQRASSWFACQPQVLTVLEMSHEFGAQVAPI